MAKHNTYIFSEDAKSQAQFYTEALGGEILSVMTYGGIPNTPEEHKDKVMHMSFLAAGVQFFMSDNTFEPINYGSSINLCLEFETDAQAHAAFDNLAAGGQVKSPLESQAWGSLFGLLEDKYGVMWMITTEAKAN